jgi:hypothetical protein
MMELCFRSGQCCLVFCAIFFLVRPIQAGDTSPPIQHLPRTSDGWSVAQSENFRVLHKQSRDFAEQAAHAAERAQAAALKKWFGSPKTEGLFVCEIFLHATGADYNRATGVSAQVPGHSTVNRDGGRIISVRVDVHCDVANLLIGVLPHEVTHAVVATQFGPQRVPPWANEAMAVLSETRPLIDKHLRNLPRHRQEGQLFRLPEMVAMKEYPTASRFGPFYSQSTSLVEFLANAKESTTFPQFVREGLESDWETALKKHYGWSFDELERRWRIHAFPDIASR